MYGDLMFGHSAGREILPALVGTDGETVTYGALAVRVEAAAARLRGPKQLVFFLIENSVAAVVVFLGALRAGHAVALVSPDQPPPALEGILARYRPDLVIKSTGFSAPVGGYASRDTFENHAIMSRETLVETFIHPSNMVLLSTSGSTGSPKFVRLSGDNLRSNARDIVDVMAITPLDRAAGHLKLHYSFGLSILTSHLAAGACTVFTADAFTSGAFWKHVRTHECTSLPGVPFHYEMLRRLGLDRLNVPSIKICSQAGGRLAAPLIEMFAGTMAARGGRFYVMYGQTEASPRMTTLPADLAITKMGSVGRAMPSGSIEIHGLDGQALGPGEEGEVVYAGPNVMLGYAGSRSDLAIGELQGGRLKTGDLGRLDEDGCLWVTGRISRIAKILGLRVSLDELEGQVCGRGRVAAIERQGKLVVTLEGADGSECDAVAAQLHDTMRFHPSSFEIRTIETIPVKANGKVDYAALARDLA